MSGTSGIINSMQNAVLEVKNLTKKFGSKAGEFTAVDNLSLEIADGEILGLLGPNGAGKTTTIQMLLGVMIPSSGTVQYFGKNFFEHRSAILKKVNYSSTYISLPYQFTVAEILEVFAHLYEVPDRKKRIQKLLVEFDLLELQKKQFFMLSAGEKTRLLLTKAFINYPKIILLDEPTASLDPEIAVKVREFLKKEKKEYNVSILFTSHNMAEVEEMCDRVIILNHGKIIAEDTPEKLAKTLTACYVELFIKKDAERAKAFFIAAKIVSEQEGNFFKIKIEEQHVTNLLTELAKEKISYSEITINKPDLEDYFLQILEKKND